MATSKMAPPTPPKGGTGNTGGTSVGAPNQGGTSVSGDTGAGAVMLGQGDASGSAMATASGLLQGAGEVVELDPRGTGGFDLIARVFRDVGSLKTDVNGLKQRV